MTKPIISAHDLARLLENEGDLVLLDCRASAEAWAAGHLPGAWHADVNRDLSAATEPDADARQGGRHPLPPFERWARQLGAWGIGPETYVIAVDDQYGANAAARAWWMLRSIGHERVSVLDGGMAAALAEGIALTTDSPSTAPKPPYPAPDWSWKTVDIATVDRLREDRQWKVLDVRSGPRFRGETEPIDPIAGHIPGAVNLFYEANLRDGRFKPAAELRQQYEELLGHTPVEQLIVHCGSGVTACHTLLALDLAGLHGASLYVGSWGEWCRSELPRS